MFRNSCDFVAKRDGLAVLHHLALALAKLAQRLDVNAIFPEFLFHRLRICWQR